MIIPIPDSNPSQSHERQKLETSHLMADQVLQQAYESQDALRRQQSQIFGSYTRAGALSNRFSGINSLIGKIGDKRNRDTVILGTGVGLIFITFLYFIS